MAGKLSEALVPAVNQTWLPRCDHGEFYTKTPIPDESIPYRTVFSRLNDAYMKLFWKTREALHYTYTQVSDEFDWYVKADDDAYVIVDNLREYLCQFNASEPYFLGYRLKPYLKRGYNSGGTYVLSNAAMRLFAEELYGNSTLCPFADFEDVGLAA
ncbi:Protein C16D9.6 [Aphelenchoides avenae]|nr:Protein C16D9.6 [Aphelenchus avenae]